MISGEKGDCSPARYPTRFSSSSARSIVPAGCIPLNFLERHQLNSEFRTEDDSHCVTSWPACANRISCPPGYYEPIDTHGARMYSHGWARIESRYNMSFARSERQPTHSQTLPSTATHILSSVLCFPNSCRLISFFPSRCLRDCPLVCESRRTGCVECR